MLEQRTYIILQALLRCLAARGELLELLIEEGKPSWALLL